MASTEEDKEEQRAQRDLVAYAKTVTVDLYDLLHLPSPFAASADSSSAYVPPTTTDLDKAWRKAALRYHPDKNRGDEKAAADRLDEARRAVDVLKDAEARAVYEGKRRAETERRERMAAFDGRRRQMAEALLQGEAEAAAKQTGAPKNDSEARIRELEEKGRQRRMEFIEAARRRRQQDREAAEQSILSQSGTTQSQAIPQDTRPVEELDRAVKIRWPRGTPAGDAVTQETVQTTFARFGTVESTVILKDKKVRLDPVSGAEANGKRPKQLVGSAVVVFESIVAAHAAVHDATALREKHKDEPSSVWSVVESVAWARGQGPDLGFASTTQPSRGGDGGGDGRPDWDESTRQTLSASQLRGDALDASTKKHNTPVPCAAQTNTPAEAPPSFSFSPAAARRVEEAANTDSTAPTTTPLQRTMMRLKEAERARRAAQERLELEAQMRADEAASG